VFCGISFSWFRAQNISVNVVVDVGSFFSSAKVVAFGLWSGKKWGEKKREQNRLNRTAARIDFC
jgi:hypothetical protein